MDMEQPSVMWGPPQLFRFERYIRAFCPTEHHILLWKGVAVVEMEPRPDARCQRADTCRSTAVVQPHNSQR